jgi:hypothetical protein
MASVYTCPYCHRRYTIYRDGDYLCDCGRVFFYPPLLSSEKANFIALAPAYADSASRSVRRTAPAESRRRTARGAVDCPLARISLICGLLGVVFFGITSLPGLVLGIAAKLMIADPYYNYKGDGLALGGIFSSLLGIIVWGLWLTMRI